MKTLKKITSNIIKKLPLFSKPRLNDDPVLYSTSDRCWGSAVYWTDINQFKDGHKGPYRVHGFKIRRPSVGDVLKAEMVESIMYFVFVNVEYCSDPHDMFFGDVMPYRQEMKTGEVIGLELPEFKPQKQNRFVV